MSPTEETPPPAGAPGPAKTYTCGTLVYTLPKLIVVFLWLMLGGLVYSFCLNMPGQMLPIQLRELGLSDTAKMVILTTIGGVLNMTVCPYIGFVSDRYRSRWGRRIPFIMMSLPFLVLSLFAFAFTDRIGPWLADAVSGVGTVAPATMTMVVIAIVMFIYQFFYMFVGSVIWYLFNDIIPPQFFGRVYGVFQMGLTLGSAAFQFFVFEYAGEYYSTIFIAGAVLYSVGMGLMCLMVKEGGYPPVEKPPAEAAKPWAERCLAFIRVRIGGGFKTFVRESLCHRFYVLRYALTTALALTGAAGALAYYFNLEMGLDNKLMGRLAGTSQMITAISMIVVTSLASVLIDRWHPMRIYIYNTLFLVAGQLVSLRWLFGTVPPDVYVYSAIVGSVFGVVWSVLVAISGLPMEMLTFPKSRFGSFCSAQALLRSSVVTVVAVFVGGIFDGLFTLFESDTFHYRFVPVWPIPWSFVALALGYFTYRQWGKLGGYANYRAPAPWSPEGWERLPQPKVHAPGARFLTWVIRGYDALILVSLGSAVYFIVTGTDADRLTVLWSLNLPLCGLILAAWAWVRSALTRDLRLCLAGEAPRAGIPHHGPLLLYLIALYGTLGIVTYHAAILEGKAGAAHLLTQELGLFTFVGVIALLRHMERGIVTRVAETEIPETDAPGTPDGAADAPPAQA